MIDPQQRAWPGVNVSTTSVEDVAERKPFRAVLPVGSFEQHGGHLPLLTDTLVAAAISQSIVDHHGGLLLPAIPFGCSQEHKHWRGTVSVRSSSLFRYVHDVVHDLAESGFSEVALVSAHGGNYVLSNLAQEINADPWFTSRTRLILYPSKGAWTHAREEAGIATSTTDDMHAGEVETSIAMSAGFIIREATTQDDFVTPSRDLLTTLGLHHYSERGVAGRPSHATPEKGRILIDSLGDYYGTLAAEVARSAE